MATLQEVETALRNADAAGDAEAARALAAEVVRLRDTGGYFANQSKMAREGFSQMARGAGQVSEAVKENLGLVFSGARNKAVPATPANRIEGAFSALDPSGPQAPLTTAEVEGAERASGDKLMRGVGNVLGGAAGYVASPINAAYDTYVGEPVENLTGIPKEYTSFAAQLATPGLGLTRLPSVPARTVTPPRPGLQVSEAGERLGIDLPRAATSDSTVVQQYGKVAANVPAVGTPLVNASKRAVEGLADAATGARAAFGSGSPSSAGQAARTGIDEYVRSGPIKQRVSELYDTVDSLVDQTVSANILNTSRVANVIAARRANAALPESAAVKELDAALSRPMNYQGVKDLRTYFGEMLDGSLPIPQGISHGEVKQIYGALSADMRTIIERAGGPNALRAYERAERSASRWAGIREDLGRLLKVQSEEAIFDKIAAMAGSSARADLSLLGRVRGAVGPHNWDEIASAVIAKMGWPPGGAGFSPDAFLTAFNKMSPEGRRLLFRSTNKASHADAIDDIAKVSQRFKQLNEFANPSGTGRVVTGTGQIAAVFQEPMTAISAIVGTRIMSHMLARPTTARHMADWSKSYLAAAQKMTPQSLDAFQKSSRVLAAGIGRDFSRPDLIPALVDHLNGVVIPFQGPMRSAADNEQPEAPRGINQ